MAACSIKLSWRGVRTVKAGPAMRGMSRRMACAGSVMASLRKFEEKPGAARAGDGRSQRPVREHDIDPGEREALEPGMREVRLEAIALSEGVEEVRERNARGHALRPAREDGDRVVDAREHDDEVDGRPGRGLGPRAEEEDETAHEEPDDER